MSRIQINIMVIILTFAFGCSTSIENNDKSESENLFGVMEQVIKNTEDPNCFNDVCTKVNLSYPTFSLSPKISRFNENLVRKQLSYYAKAGNSASLDELTESIFDDYYVFLENFPESKTPWNISLVLTLSFVSEKLICLKLKENSYTGGAHASEMVYFITINPLGEILSTENWISDIDQLKKLAEDAFRKTVKMNSNETYADRGFQFEDDRFQLPENIGRSSKEIILYYNSYEIGSYSDGLIEVKIPIEKVLDIVVK